MSQLFLTWFFILNSSQIDLDSDWTTSLTANFACIAYFFQTDEKKLHLKKKRKKKTIVLIVTNPQDNIPNSCPRVNP